MNKIKMGIAVGILATVMQLWQPVKGYSQEFYGYPDQCYFFRPFLNNLVFDGGYRWDKVIKSEIVEGVTFGSANSTWENLSSVQLGGKGAFCFGNDFYVRGSGHYGILVDGHFSSAVLSTSQVRGYTWDVSGAAGYLFNCYNCLAIAPVVGFSYDKHHLANRVFVSALDDIVGIQSRREKAEFKWYGPFIGADFFFNACNWAFDAGYELHIGHNKTETFNLPLSEGPRHGTNKHMLGHVWHLDGLYPLGCGWTIGFGLKYTLWNNQKRSSSHIEDPAAAGEVGNRFFNNRIQWHSLAATVDVGFAF